MNYLLLIYENERVMNDMPPEEQGRVFAEYHAFTEGIVKSVRVKDGKVVTTDGPFAETKEQLGGYYLIDAEDLDEAVAIAARIPAARVGTVEVRPVMVFDQGGM